MPFDISILYPMIGFAPGLAWLVYMYVRYRRAGRPFSRVVPVFLLGAVCTAPALLFLRLAGGNMGHDSLLNAAYACFVATGPIEEFFKLVPVWFGVYRSSEFREPMDGVLYAVTAALGFVAVENFAYIGDALSRPAGLTLLGLLDRGLYATPAHVLFASVWGYALGVARFRREGEMLTVGLGLGLSALLHGGYDFLAELLIPVHATLWLVPYMASMGLLLYLGIRKFRRGYPFPSLGDGALVVCPSCGAYALECERVCPRCGAEVVSTDADAPRYCGRCRARLGPRQETCSRCGVNLTLAHACSAAP